MMKRREFVQYSTLASIGLSFPFSSMLEGCSEANSEQHSEEFRELVFNLLKDWCDGMIQRQINKPSDPALHGMLKCPACDVVHARFQDAVYPFFYMAKATREEKYLEAGINVFEWAESNVSRPDGSWTNDLDPQSWNGTTVFGAIALAETLKYHSDLIDKGRVAKWEDRLSKAAEFIYKKFPSIDATNVNYGATNIYALLLIGEVLGNTSYTKKSKELALQIRAYFTEPNALLYGEIKPSVHKRSAKGLPGVDLGYNVEESLNSIVMYALHEDDQELLEILSTSLLSHLEFMLPDGGWDNSWGTRMFKWTYWGSRTSDGCQPAFGLMAGYNPAFGTAAVKNTLLLKRCTSDGLLHGGLHYVSHGIKPCIHHTFTHAKPLAFMLDHWEHLPTINAKAQLPRVEADGTRYFEELDVVLFSRGDWRGTVSAYDSEYYHKKQLRQATGNALSLLYHQKVGLLCAASMAIYKQMEPLNQQDQPGEDIALTPRLEVFKNGTWYTNLFDLTATFDFKDENGSVRIVGNVQLRNEDRKRVQGITSDFEISYTCSKERLKITAQGKQSVDEGTTFTLPIISSSEEKISQVDANIITVEKPGGIVRISSNVPLQIKKTRKNRTFNMVPGVEAIPIMAHFISQKVELSIDILDT